MYWISKKHATSKTITYGYELMAVRRYVEHIIDLRTTLRYLYVGIFGSSYMLGDSCSGVLNLMNFHTTLQKMHNVLSFHGVEI